MPKIAMRTQSARVGRLGDEAGTASLSTAASGRGRGAADAGPCGLAFVTGESAVALRGCAFGSVAMGGLNFLSLIVLPEYYDRV